MSKIIKVHIIMGKNGSGKSTLSKESADKALMPNFEVHEQQDRQHSVHHSTPYSSPPASTDQRVDVKCTPKLDLELTRTRVDHDSEYHVGSSSHRSPAITDNVLEPSPPATKEQDPPPPSASTLSHDRNNHLSQLLGLVLSIGTNILLVIFQSTVPIIPKLLQILVLMLSLGLILIISLVLVLHLLDAYPAVEPAAPARNVNRGYWNALGRGVLFGLYVLIAAVLLGLMLALAAMSYFVLRAHACSPP